jgi:hypothetical protein
LGKVTVTEGPISKTEFLTEAIKKGAIVTVAEANKQEVADIVFARCNIQAGIILSVKDGTAASNSFTSR